MSALNFPDAPSPGQVFANWKWDGSKWINTPASSGMPMGVTDGSDAIPGQVGEYLQVLGHPSLGVGMPANTAVTILTLTLGAGDWDIWTGGNWTYTTTQTNDNTLVIELNINGNRPDFGVGTARDIAATVNTQNRLPFEIPTYRISSAATITVTLVGTVDAAINPTPTTNVTGAFIKARRMR